MNWKKHSFSLSAAALLILASQVHATIMLQLDLAELTERAGTIFRGTVTSVQSGTISAGGGELPTVTYRFMIDELYKGAATQVKGDQPY